MTPGSPLANRAKRVIDVVGASAALVVASPLIAATALTVWRDLGRPILFRQPRPGLRGRVFDLIKFRTMRPETEQASGLANDGARLTATGARLRSWSLDELPTLWNVLRGDMSLVGPRPLLVTYLERYTAEQARRHEVPPGVTGWAQVNGRNARDWDDKLALDIWYVDNWSLLLDLKILLATLRRVLRRDGITFPGAATMPEFRGREDERR
jgi:sugar transferase EpsL